MSAQARTIVIHGGDYAHVRGLTGEHGGGIQIDYRALPVGQIFARMLATRCFEACEFSLANYLVLRASGQHWLSALPVFPYRAFRHGLVVVRKDSPLTAFEQLEGARVGVEDYSMTAAVWVRGLLQSEYGVAHRGITWVTRRKQRLPLPASARVERTDASLEELLLEGGIDALLGFALTDFERPAHERRLRTLLERPDAAERAYYERTRVFPINHTVVLRNDLLERMPAAASAVMQAYATAKDSAYRRHSPGLLPWGDANWDEDMVRFGGDPLPYGLNAINRAVVGTLLAYLHEQEFIRERLPIDSVFLVPERS
ncbi:MAG: hypothetical protein IT531_02690 [Burkholderiales bacterium]|nr:hypothetical protein [Burkholderiales bacterium]